MDRLYTDSCGCVFHSHNGIKTGCAGRAFVGENPKFLKDFELYQLDIHNKASAVTIEAVL